jgi:hypothetical protein
VTHANEPNHSIAATGLPNSGFFQELALRAKLVLRLMGDRRVNFLAKVLPVGAIAYFLIPDLAIGPLMMPPFSGWWRIICGTMPGRGGGRACPAAAQFTAHFC